MTTKDKQFSTWEDAVQWLRAQPDRQSLVIDGYYDDPLLQVAERYRLSDEWQAIKQWLPSHQGRALDVGAGRGIASYALAKDGYLVNALEPDPSALVGAQAIAALSQEAGLAIQVTQEFSEKLPYPDGSFDVVFARAVLHHTRDLEAACQEFYRVLKPGGRLIAVREHVISRKKDLPKFLAIHPLHNLYGGENAFLLSEYTNALKFAGFGKLSVIAPLASPINLSPYTPKTFCRELSSRVFKRAPWLICSVANFMSMPPIWAILRRLIQLIDRRPGRLYSFVAERA